MPMLGPSYGGNAKVAYKKETAWGTWGAIASAVGHAFAIDNWTDNEARQPADVRETGVSVDYDSFVEGETVVGASLTSAMRYSPISAGIMAQALGAIASTVAGAPDNHAVTLADNLPSFSYLLHVPFGPANALYEFQWTGCVARSLTISHRQGDVMRATLDMVAKDRSYIGVAAATIPNATNHYLVAAETYINWSDILLGSNGCHVKRAGGALTRIVPRSWSMTLDNAIEAPFAIGEGRYPFQPVRNNKRSVTLRMEVAMDDAFVEFLTAHGANEGASGEQLYVQFQYRKPGTSGGTAYMGTFSFSNLRSLRVAATVPGTEIAWATVELRGQYVSGGSALYPDPVKIVVSNGDTGYDFGAQW